MKRFGSIFPFLEQGPRHAPIGRLVANAEFVRALVEHGGFDEYVFGSPSRGNLEEFRQAAAAWVPRSPATQVRYADYAAWMSLLGREAFHVMHLGGWGYFMAGLHYLRVQVAPRLWPITSVIHSLHGRETIDHAMRLVSAGLLPCDAVFCTSRDGQESMRRLIEGAEIATGRRFRARLVHLPLGIPDGFVSRPGNRSHARQRVRIPDEARVVLVLGRMSPTQKWDPAPLCHALAATVFPQVGPDVFLVFAGGASPSELELLRRTVVQHQLEHRTKFQANFAPDQKRDVLALADVVVAPTDNTQETFGLSLLEAQAAGVPVVASRFDGYKDLVHDGVDGYLIDTWQAPTDLLADWFDLLDPTTAQLLQAQGVAVDLDQLCDRLVRLLGDADLRRRMGEAGRAKVQRHYRWSRVIAEYEAVWDDLAREAARLPRPDVVRNPYALGPSRIFGHYASRTLDPATPVVATGQRIVELPYRDAAGWLPRSLLDALLARSPRPIAAGDLAGKAPVAAPQAWFAIAWLLKYGLLRIATTERAAQAAHAPADSPATGTPPAAPRPPVP
jgi:glycosyltransferase involved in cell wall biosynthesis